MLEHLVNLEDWTVAPRLLYFPHGTVAERPGVVELDGQLCLQGAQEKARVDRRQDVARLVPVVAGGGPADADADCGRGARPGRVRAGGVGLPALPGV